MHRIGKVAKHYKLKFQRQQVLLVDQDKLVLLNSSSLVVEWVDPLAVRELVANLDDDAQIPIKYFPKRISTS